MKGEYKQILMTIGCGVLITLIEFIFIYWYFGFYFEGSEIASHFSIITDVADPNIPVNYNNNIFILSAIRKMQAAFSTVPVFSLYYCSLLFIPIAIFNYLLLKKRNISWPNKLVLIFFLFILVFDNVINISNSNVSILLLTAYAIFLHQKTSVLGFSFSFLLFLLACLVRVEYGIFFSFIFLFYYFIIKPDIKKYKIIATLILTIGIYSAFLINLNKSDIYAKTVFKYEREFLDKENYKSINIEDLDYEKKSVFQKAIITFLEDRDNIQPEDYYQQLEYKTLREYILSYKWIGKYIERLQFVGKSIVSNILYIFISLVALLCLFNVRTMRGKLFFLIVIAFPFVIMFQALMVPRFFIPYITAFIIIFIIQNRDYMKSARWLSLIVSLFIISPFVLKAEKAVASEYEFHHNRFEELNAFYKKLNEEGKLVILSNTFLSYYYTPNLFYTKEVAPHYYMSFIFWHYYDSFRSKRSEFFKDQSCILSNLQDIANHPHAVLISDEKYMSFLKEYLYYYHQSKLDYLIIDRINSDFEVYKIEVTPL